MKKFPALDRRRLLAFLFACVADGAARGGAKERPKDNGLGGTGYISVLPDIDNGLGGTGVVGTIRGFGSILVNGLKISYAPTAEVTIDGRTVDVSHMRIGHVVSLVAESKETGFTTTRIRILREVVGPIESIVGRSLRVLGQKVELGPGVAAAGLAVGRHVAVSGLRMPDQTIVASLVEPVEAGAEQIVGTVTRDAQGRLAIGTQPLSGVARSLAGQRVALRGAVAGGGFDVSAVAQEEWVPRGVLQAVVETYVERDGATIEAAGTSLTTPRDASFKGVARAVIGLVMDQSGGWSIKTFRVSESLGDKGSGRDFRQRMKDARETAPAPSGDEDGSHSGAGAQPPDFGNGPPGGFGGPFGPGGGSPPGGLPGPGGPGGGPPRR
ncbi:hypothetical protein [Methylocystis heyeri]|uniref:DUF5666 domain-containing protein n=1 Tax=Methylocystis heyeri TaxID=391905 RepID=A0A6B8KKS1_9HYPH|nr:hypothetical protein [Methylocystis heyeri]QGM47310.1 hypothetical protein H2LOC_017340 [Methylocystis heyeri]